MPPMRRSAAWIAPSNTGLSAWSGCSRWGRCNGGKCGESMCVCPKSWGYPQIIQVDCLSIEAYGDLGILHFRIPPYEYESRFKTCDICDHRFWALTIWFLKWPNFHTPHITVTDMLHGFQLDDHPDGAWLGEGLLDIDPQLAIYLITCTTICLACISLVITHTRCWPTFIYI